MKISVAVAGGTGKTGSAVTRVLLQEDDIEIVGAVGNKNAGRDLGEVLGLSTTGILIRSSLEELLRDVHADVLVDFTTPQTAGANAIMAAMAGVRPVVGTTGIPQHELDKLSEICFEKGLAAAIIPNFSYGAMLMAEFCELALQYFQDVEIIEKHHKTKLDSPSGTARRLAQRLEQLAGSNEIPVHSLRLPGFVAHHEVVFGGLGETLTIKHDTISRDSFAPGVLMVVRKIERLRGMYYDLHQVLKA